MRAEGVIFFAGFFVSLMRFFKGVKQAQANRFVINLYFSKPAFVFAAHTCKAAAVVFTQFMAVMRVFLVSSFTQIAKPIVGSVAVYVVNLMRRPFAGHVKPRKSVREIQIIVEPNNIVSVLHAAPCFSARRAPSAFSVPCELARFWVIVNQMAKALGRKFVLHDTVNINSWRGCQA